MPKFSITEAMNLVSSETKAYLEKISNTETGEKELARIIDIGVSVIQRVELTRDVEYIKKEAKNIALNFEKVTDEKITFMVDELEKIVTSNFDPNKDSSYLKMTIDYLRKELEQFKLGVSNSVKLMMENAEKVSTDKLTQVNDSLEKIGEKLNPDLETSYIGKLKNTVVKIEDDIKNNLDNARIGSFAYNLEETLAGYFGERSPILEQTSFALTAFSGGINAEIIKLREEIARKEGANEMLKSTAIKGFAFEDQVEEVISKYASVNNEVYVNTAKVSESSGTSKKGDFVFETTGGDRLVIEAKDKLYNNLKPTLKYLDEAMEARSCTFAVLVSKHVDQLPKNSLGFNLYEGNKLFCTLDFLPYALQFAKLYLNIKEGDSAVINTDVIKVAMEKLQNQVKNFTAMKTKLTTLTNNVTNGVEDVKTIITLVQGEINTILSDVNYELNK